MPAKENPKTNENRIDYLWKIISRFDFFIGTTNLKASIISAFDVFIFSALVLKWEEILKLFNTYSPFPQIATILIATTGLASLVSLWWAFYVINPFLKSTQRPKQYHSLVFFEHIAQFNSPDDYLNVFRKQNDEEMVQDLSFQAHALAIGAKDKFTNMKKSVSVILWMQLPAIGLLLLLKVICLVF